MFIILYPCCFSVLFTAGLFSTYIHRFYFSQSLTLWCAVHPCVSLFYSEPLDELQWLLSSGCKQCCVLTSKPAGNYIFLILFLICYSLVSGVLHVLQHSSWGLFLNILLILWEWIQCIEIYSLPHRFLRLGKSLTWNILRISL